MAKVMFHQCNRVVVSGFISLNANSSGVALASLNRWLQTYSRNYIGRVLAWNSHIGADLRIQQTSTYKARKSWDNWNVYENALESNMD